MDGTVKHCITCDEVIAVCRDGEYFDLRDPDNPRRMTPQAYRPLKRCPACAKKRRYQQSAESVWRARYLNKQYGKKKKEAIARMTDLIIALERRLAEVGAV